MLNRLRRYFQSAGTKTCVIITGNPKYVKTAYARAFYTDLKEFVEGLGYTVSFDPGRPFTSPDETATAWIGHSRGSDRLRFAPPGVKAVAIGCPLAKIQNGKRVMLSYPFPVINHPQDNAQVFNKDTAEAPNRYHFALTEAMKAELAKVLA